MVELPDAEPGKPCSTPYDCEFWDRCTADKPADWVAYLPRLSPARASQLKALGIDAISSIPPDFPLTAKQAIIRDAVGQRTPVCREGYPTEAPALSDLPRAIWTLKR